MWCKSRFFLFSMLMLLDEDANAIFLFKMQMSYAGMKMQSLFMMMPAHIFNRDARVFLQGWRCKFLMVQVPSNGYVMMQMPLVGMSWWKCPPGGYAMMQMSAWEYAMAWMSSCRYAMNANAPLWVYHDTRCFGANTIYSKISFIFKTRLPQRLKPKYSQNLIYYS